MLVFTSQQKLLMDFTSCYEPRATFSEIAKDWWSNPDQKTLKRLSFGVFITKSIKMITFPWRWKKFNTVNYFIYECCVSSAFKLLKTISSFFSLNISRLRYFMSPCRELSPKVLFRKCNIFFELKEPWFFQKS